jgi:hypothetical protein
MTASFFDDLQDEDAPKKQKGKMEAETEASTKRKKCWLLWGAIGGLVLLVVIVVVVVISMKDQSTLSSASSSGASSPPPTPRPTTPPSTTPMPTVEPLQLICAWLSLSLTSCPSASSASPLGDLGSIPTQIGLLTSLTHLNLSNNGLTGSIPFQIGKLTSLTYLGLSHNALLGSIPSQIGQLTSLTTLYLHNNALTAGTIPSFVCNGGGRAFLDCDKITPCSCCACY